MLVFGRTCLRAVPMRAAERASPRIRAGEPTLRTAPFICGGKVERRADPPVIDVYKVYFGADLSQYFSNRRKFIFRHVNRSDAAVFCFLS